MRLLVQKIYSHSQGGSINKSNWDDFQGFRVRTAPPSPYCPPRWLIYEWLRVSGRSRSSEVGHTPDFLLEKQKHEDQRVERRKESATRRTAGWKSVLLIIQFHTPPPPLPEMGGGCRDEKHFPQQYHPRDWLICATRWANRDISKENHNTPTHRLTD